MTNKEAINLIDIIRMGYICDPQECGEIATGGTTYEGELCDIFKCYDYHDACVMAIEALEKLEEITKGIEDLKETLRDAYKSNDYVLDKVVRNISLTECEALMVSFTVKVMQNLGWLLGVLDWSEEE